MARRCCCSIARVAHAARARRSIYGNAKLANMLFTLELKKRLAAHAPGVIAVACHPGYTATNLQLTPGKGPTWLMGGMNALFAQGVRMGAQPQLYAALGEDIESGDFTGPASFSKGPAIKARGVRAWRACGADAACALPAQAARASRAKDEAAAAKLWALTAKLTKFDYLEN